MAVGRRPVRKSTILDPYLKLILKMSQPWPLLVLLLAFSQFHDSSCIKMYKPKKQSVAVFLSGIGRSTRQWWPPNIRLSVNNLWRNRHRTSRLSRTMIALTLRCSHYTLLYLSDNWSAWKCINDGFEINNFNPNCCPIDTTSENRNCNFDTI